MSTLSTELASLNRGRPPARGRVLTTLTRVESAKLGTSAMLWIGALGGTLVSLGAAGSVWPLLTGSAGLTYRQANIGIANLPVGGLRIDFLSFLLMPSGWLVLAGFAMLAGAFLGRRDRRCGAEELLVVTPTSRAGIRAARLGALALASSIAIAFLFGAVLVVEATSGARGSIDWLILLDGCLGTTLASWIGYAVGSSLPAAFSLFVPIVYVGGSFYLSVWQGTSVLRPSIEWLLPTPPAPNWSADLGFLPNIFPEHIVYLVALLLLTGGAVLGLPLRRGPEQPERHRVALSIGVLGLAAAVCIGAGLQAKPDSYAVASPSRATWAPEYYSVPDNIGFDCSWVGNSPLANAPRGATPCDVSAWFHEHAPVSCATDRSLSVCVYRDYGLLPARRLLAAMRSQAPVLAGLFGRPVTVRMVPVDTNSCFAGAGKIAIDESMIAYGERFDPAYLISCVFPGKESDLGPVDVPAVGGVTLWLAIRSGLVTASAAKAALVSAPAGVSCFANLPCTPQSGGVLSPTDSGLSWTRADIRVALFLDRDQESRVVAALRPLLPRLIDATLTPSDLEHALG